MSDLACYAVAIALAVGLLSRANVVELATECVMQSNPVWLFLLRTYIKCLYFASRRCEFSFRATYAIPFRACLLLGHRVETLIRETKCENLGFINLTCKVWSQPYPIFFQSEVQLQEIAHEHEYWHWL